MSPHLSIGTTPVLVAIVGGSGSGKTWLAGKLEKALAPNALRISLDDFYSDRSHLPPARRARINFDHPRAIDWQRLMKVLKGLSVGRATRVPCYDFKTHCRVPRWKIVKPKPIIIVEGLWVLRLASIRRLLSLSIFLQAPRRARLRRRIIRDLATRGRTLESIRQQFFTAVEPMHERYVVPQADLADVVLRKRCGVREIRRLGKMLRGYLKGGKQL